MKNFLKLFQSSPHISYWRIYNVFEAGGFHAWIFLHIFNHVLLAFIKELLTIHRTHLRLWNFCSSSLEMIDNIFTLNIVIIHSQTLRRKFSRVEGRTDNRISPESLLCLSTFVTASPRKPWGRGMSEPNKILEVKVIFQVLTPLEH